MDVKKSLRTITILSLFLFVAGFSTLEDPGQRRKPSVKKALEEFAADQSLKNASWGFYALDTRTGKEIISHNPDLALIPASAQKVITTLTALSLLGDDYRYETLLQYDGSIENGTLKGNLYILGSGDPTLGSPLMDDSLKLEKIFNQWLQDIKASGIQRIEGAIIADGSAFDDHMLPPKWMWEDIGNYYGAGSHALTVHENKYTVFFNPGRREGDKATVAGTDPIVPGMTFHNDVTTGPRGSGDRVYIYGSPYSHERWLTGTVPLGEPNFRVRGSMPDPGFFLAATLKEFLTQQDIEPGAEVFTHRSAPDGLMTSARITLSRWLSPPLVDIAARTNFASVNTYAENLLKTMGKTFGEKGTFQAGSKVVRDFWEEKGIDVQGMRMHDGSGLSSFNTITVRQLTEMLHFASSDEALYNNLVKGFPVAGESGSLARMFLNTSSAGVLSAKSGFLSNVRSYTGYTRCRDGHLIAFTIIVNNYSGTPLEMRRKMERVMDALTGMRL